ncbi:uncharacterized protein LOC121549830 isoform X2 [Coregonus clupeaformis]|uniref:uncharacterized protein LOC121549830 isoform X2 n=1 Tax=Coregonus clupeaformis TaxID=59861 RepID=UPI001E1C7968|nr:uncharacterized protein LOC121549830 isoform X2 [Coregonus clupeaformis]
MVMEFPTTLDLDPGPVGPPGGQKQPVKSHLLASRELLVASLYNLAPLLDRTLAAGLLSQENYFEVGAERTPQGRARRLLEVVQAEMDEAGARGFMECLRRCKQHYPRLRAWLRTDADIQRGPTERKLQAQLSVLCGRLGFSVLPVSLELFSNGTLTQFELDQVQAVPTSYQQTHQLLSICLSKGERACCSFYQALGSEDQQLASDISVSGLVEALPDISVVSGHEAYITSVAVEDPGVCSTPVEVKDYGDCSTPIAVETRHTDGEVLSLPDTHILSGVLQQVLALLAVAPGEGARLNVCELGVAVGLPRRTVRECLLDGVGVGDIAQLRALVTLFLIKTQDASRLLSRVAECTAHRVLLSERGYMLLKLLPVAEAFLHSWDHHPCKLGTTSALGTTTTCELGTISTLGTTTTCKLETTLTKCGTSLAFSCGTAWQRHWRILGLQWNHCGTLGMLSVYYETVREWRQSFSRSWRSVGRTGELRACYRVLKY